jgi:hypothetical protein
MVFVEFLLSIFSFLCSVLYITVRPFVLCSYGHCIVWISSSNDYCSSLCPLFLWQLYCLNSFFEWLLFVLVSFVLKAIALSEFLLRMTTVRPCVLCSYGHCIVWIPSSNDYCSSLCPLFLWPLYCLNSFFEWLPRVTSLVSANFSYWCHFPSYCFNLLN